MASPETGYVIDQEYTHGYYAELNPLRLRLALLNAGLKPPVIEHASSIPFASVFPLTLSAGHRAAHYVVIESLTFPSLDDLNGR